MIGVVNTETNIHSLNIYSPCPAPPCANYLQLPYGCPGNTTQAEVTTSEH